MRDSRGVMRLNVILVLAASRELLDCLSQEGLLSM